MNTFLTAGFSPGRRRNFPGLGILSRSCSTQFHTGPGVVRESHLFIFRSLDDRNYVAAHPTAAALACISFMPLFAMEYLNEASVGTANRAYVTNPGADAVLKQAMQGHEGARSLRAEEGRGASA